MNNHDSLPAPNPSPRRVDLVSGRSVNYYELPGQRIDAETLRKAAPLFVGVGKLADGRGLLFNARVALLMPAPSTEGNFAKPRDPNTHEEQPVPLLKHNGALNLTIGEPAAPDLPAIVGVVVDGGDAFAPTPNGPTELTDKLVTSARELLHQADIET